MPIRTLLHARGDHASSATLARRPLPRRLILLLGALATAAAALMLFHPWEFRSTDAVPRFLVPRLIETSLGPPRTAPQHERAANSLVEFGHYLSALEQIRMAERVGARGDALRRLKARVLLTLGREEEAETIYRELAARNPGDPELLLRLAITQIQLDRRDDARQTLGALVGMEMPDRSRHEAVLRQAITAYLSLSEPREALTLARRYQQLKPEDPGGHVAAGKAALALRDPPTAVRELERARALAPRDGAIRMLRAHALFTLRGYRYDPAIVRELREAVRLDPYLGRAHYYLARYYASRRDWKNAAGEYLKAYDLGSEPVQSLQGVGEACLRVGMEMEGHYRLAQYHELLGNIEGALAHFAMLWRKQPCCAAGYARHSDALRRAGRLPKALEIVRRGLRKVPGDVTLTRRLAETYMLLTRLENAKPPLQRLLQSDRSRLGHTYRDLAAVAEGQAQYDQAEEYYHRSLEAESDSVDTRMRLGQLYFQRRTMGGRLRLAEREFRWVVERSPEMDEASSMLANVYAEQGKFRDAIDLVRHAIDLAPGRGRYYLQLIQLCRRDGQRDAERWALDEYRKYQRFEQQLLAHRQRVRATPRDPMRRLEFGRFLLQAGDFNAAVKELQAAVALRPTLREARFALAAAYDGQGRSEDAAAVRATPQ